FCGLWPRRGGSVERGQPIQRLPQHRGRETPISGGHGVEIEVEPEAGAFLVNQSALCGEMLVGVDNLVGRDRVGDAFDGDLPTLLALDPVANMRVSLIRDEYFAGCRRSLKPRCEVHAASDDGVVHPFLTAEVPDG